MSSWNLVHLDFGRSPAHFGTVGIGIEGTSERVRSDTLFSAWVSTYAQLFGKDAVEALLKTFLDSPQEPPFRISSTFIYSASWQAETPCYYLPKPLGFPINYPQRDDLAFAKTYRNLKYLPLTVWQRWYQGEGFSECDRTELENYTPTHPNKAGALYRAGTFDYKKTHRIQTVPKVAIDRTSRATNFYHTGFVQFKWREISESSSDPQQAGDLEANTISRKREVQESGLYFLIQFPTADPTLEANLRAALDLLGEDGIGGERSSGAGRFEPEWLPLPAAWETLINFAKTPTHHCLLSLFWSDEKAKLALLLSQPEDAADQVSYEILERGGWMTATAGHRRRRKMVPMFGEGSVFPQSVFPQPPKGKLANVTPEKFDTRKNHKIYRSGIGLSLPIVVAPAVAPVVDSPSA